ncbi:MAG: septal ring lytic transglycosylase RlpA family protein [Terracidiphilus sp.]|jgi:rare lipoprotein A
MVRIRKTRNLRRKAPLWFVIAAGVSAVALVALVVLLTARTVQADAGLPRPAVTQSAASPATSATPASLADQELQNSPPSQSPEAKQWHDKVHGVASWYGGVFNGRRTASGEVFDMYALTACHPTLPFGSLVRVVNRSNHRSVVVRITDRGDLVEEERIIDLSYGAAQKLGMTWAGLAKVDLEVLSLGKPVAVR